MKKLFLLLTLAIFALASCKKEVTQVIHQEAQGIVFTILPEDWAANDDSTALFADFEVPELNDAVLDHGAVLVYISLDKGESYEAVPEVIDYLTYTAVHSKGWVTVVTRDVDGLKLGPPSTVVWAKVILIDTEKLALHPNVNLQNYNEVKRAFHLHE